MKNDSAKAGATLQFAAWLGRMLMALVAQEDLRVRCVIANTTELQMWRRTRRQARLFDPRVE